VNAAKDLSLAAGKVVAGKGLDIPGEMWLMDFLKSIIPAPGRRSGRPWIYLGKRKPPIQRQDLGAFLANTISSIK